jgi:hypothetical protein
MGTLYYAVNKGRKELFCLGKWGHWKIVQPMLEGQTDLQIIGEYPEEPDGAFDHFVECVVRLRAFSADEAVHEDDVYEGLYDDYTYVDSVHPYDADRFGKTVLQYDVEQYDAERIWSQAQ